MNNELDEALRKWQAWVHQKPMDEISTEEVNLDIQIQNWFSYEPE
jgi:hypothetical protein